MGGRNQLGGFFYIPGALFSFFFFFLEFLWYTCPVFLPLLLWLYLLWLSPLEVSAGFALLRIFRRREGEEEEGGGHSHVDIWNLDPSRFFFSGPLFPTCFFGEHLYIFF